MDKIILGVALAIINTHFVQLSSGSPFLKRNENFDNPFVGFYILPHGGITLDPENSDYSNKPAFNSRDSKSKAIKLHIAMEQAAEALIRSRPDVIIFSTPHGFQMDNRNVILMAESVSGNAGPGNFENFTASFDIDTSLSRALFSALRLAKNPVERIFMGSPQVEMPLLWAEVIPWYFIRSAAKKAKVALPKAIYIGQAPGANMDYLQNLGRDISKIAILQRDFQRKRIAVVISGDMSHYHSNDTRSPYPYSPISDEFDKYLVNWAKLDRNEGTESESSNELLTNAGGIQDSAGHCGFTGFVMLHGMMEELVNQNWNYTAKFYAYETPSYFGMMVASWIPG